MKKTFLFGLFTMLFCMTASAQFKFGAGINIDLDDSLFGITGKGHYQINDDYAGQASFTYFFEKDLVKFWTLDLDVHYGGFDIGDLEGFHLTPFAGLNIANASVDIGGFGGSDTEMGINIGINATIPITESLDLFIEPKLIISGIDGIGIAAGVYF